MKIDKPYNNNNFIKKSLFAWSPRMLYIHNSFFPGMPADFISYNNHHPIDKRPGVLV